MKESKVRPFVLDTLRFLTRLGQSRCDVWTLARTAGAGLDFREHSFATRFAKAFRHAATLCGGKPSIF